MNMVTINGVRYRRDDAERLGLLRDAGQEQVEAKKAPVPRNKARTPQNKAVDRD